MNVTSATDATNNTSSTTGSSSTTSSNSVDYNTFLQLLIAEMKNQDPTNPMDTSQYMSQFAQLSSVEQARLQPPSALMPHLHSLFYESASE